MIELRRRQRILILSLLSFTVFAPLILFSDRLKLLAFNGRNEFVEDLSSITYRTDTLKLNSIEKEDARGLEEPKQVVYKENDFVPTINYSSKQRNDSEESGIVGYRRFNDDKKENQQVQRKGSSSISGEKKKFNETVPQYQNMNTQSQRKKHENIGGRNEQSDQKTSQHHQTLHSWSHKASNERVMEIKDQIIRAKAYLMFAPPGSTSRLVKELKLRIKEMEQIVGEANKDSDLPRSALQKMKHMEASLSKANRAYPHCHLMASKLRAMNYNAEEQVRTQLAQVSYLVHLAARTTSKGLHCLSMRLTAEYFALRPEERKFPNENRIDDPELYHYAVFSDNVLACAVVVNSTVSTAKEPEKLVFHVVTNSLNFPAISMWFIFNPPGQATLHIQNIDKFKWMSKYSGFKKQNFSDPRYNSELNCLRFYLPDIFPALNKIVLFDHDMVIQQDLSDLWNVKMKEKVNGAVGTCQEGDTSFYRINTLINFSDPFIAERFDGNACTWAFGMNLFDLKQWRRLDLTGVYHKYLEMGSERPLWNAGSLPIGWLTFYNKTMVLDGRWHVHGLGYNSGIDRNKIERAAVIHYDGIRKPWLDIAMGRYKGYWTKFINYDHPILQQCNVHE
ncbi:probable galacturonosyltransferase 6 isoform X2 [Prosopis cineraria]|uniref:probable galacturonosyltransferase 6 isoform X2 n=1 Tax=Prosopis cineraria TaxID=364024 RepID=UPI002410A555|nr:probable galacturonosyltransferase 6 isoform X2 [Prosopis cineraria]